VARRFFRTPEIGAATALVVAGVLARLLRYGACFPLREGEDYVAATLVTRALADLHRPLGYETVCPVGFLWLEGLVVRVFGISEYALRLVPLVFGIGALLLFARVARRALPGTAGVFAMGFLAVAYQSIRQSAEAKHYTLDLFFAVLIGGLTLGLLSAPRERRRLWIAGLAAVMPVAVVCSLTSGFVAAAAILAIGWTDAFGRGNGAPESATDVFRRLAPAAGLAAVAIGCLAALWVLQLAAVSRAVRSTGALTEAWKGVYPPVSSGRLATWLLETHTGRMFAYPFGDKNLGSLATTVLFVLGLVEARRRRWTGLLLLVGTPFLFGLGAAFLHLYPYGDNDRLVVYLAPGICLMAGLGAATLLARLEGEAKRRRVLLGAAGALVLAGLAIGVDSLRQPYAGLDDEQERTFARALWEEVTAAGEAAAAWDDLKIALEPERWLWGDTGWAAAFRYYRARYGPPPWHTGDGRWRAVGPGRPLRVVTWSPRSDPPPEHESAWLDSIAKRFRLVRRRDLSVNPPSHYVVYELVPDGPAGEPLPAFPPP
jgi:hypothetical protein